MKDGLRAERLRALREARRWTQRELSARCGLADSLINKYESEANEPSVATLKTLAEAFGVTTDYLLGLTDQPRGGWVINSVPKNGGCCWPLTTKTV